jgi:hypothetical protein
MATTDFKPAYTKAPIKAPIDVSDPRDFKPRFIKSVDTPKNPVPKNARPLKLQPQPETVQLAEAESPQEPEIIRVAPKRPKSALVQVASKEPRNIIQVAPKRPIGKKAEPVPKTADEIRNSSEDMLKIRSYMMSRKGKQFQDLPDDEVYDDFINHMRYFNTNEVWTVGELRWLSDQQPEGKAIAGSAYQVYDSLGNVFVNDGLYGAVDGVADYAGAVLSSPSSWLGLGVGKVVLGGSAKVTANAATKSAVEVAKKAAIREALKVGATREIAKAAGVKAADDVIFRAARSLELKKAGIAAATDIGMGIGQNLGVQKAQIDVGNQEEYDPLQTAVVAAAGIIGGGVSYLPFALRGTSGLDKVSEKVVAGRVAERRVNQAKAAPAAQAMATKFQERMAPWEEAVAAGKDVSDSSKFRMDVTRNLLGDGVDKTPPKAGLAEDAGEKTATFTTEMGSTYKYFDDGTTIRNKAARSTAGHEGDSGVKPRSAKTVYVDTNAAELSAAGLQGLGPKGARVVIKDGKASLLTWNEQAGKWGRSPGGTDVPVYDTPAVGRYPLELWKSTDEFQSAGYSGYRGMHAGNKIVSMGKKSETSLAKGEGGLLQAMMRDAGIAIDESMDAPPVMQQVVSFALDLPVKAKAELDVAFKKSYGVSWDDTVNLVATAMSEGGQVLELASRTARKLKESVRIGIEANNAILKAAAEKNADKAPDPDVIGYIQNVWRRALVSHPATTAVNVKGWVAANAFTSLAEVVQAASVGGYGAVAALIPTKAGQAASKEALRRSKQMMAAQVYKARTLLDPYTTREAAEAFFKEAPKKYQKMIGESTFGLETGGPENFGLNPKGRVVKRTEGYLNKAATISGMNIQDTYTKSISVMTELDRLVRLKYDKGLAQLLDEGQAHKISDDVWQGAVEKGLKDTFSMDYTKGYMLSPFAKAVESLSSLPGLGFIFPFGRFMNNALAFTLEYSPFAVVPLANRMIKKGLLTKGALNELGSDEAQQTLAKVTVGMLAIAHFANIQTEKEKKGLSWNQDMDSTGAIVNNDNLSPIAAFQVLGRIASLMMRGEKAATKELIRDAGTQLVIAQLYRQAGVGGGVEDLAKYMLSITDSEVEQREFADILSTFATFIGGDIVSGFTRPFEPINTAVGVAQNSDVLIDRKQLRGADLALANTFRYLDSFFNLFTEPDENGRKSMGPPLQALTKPGDQREANPIRRITSGTREEQPLTNADRMLNMVNFPLWTQQERTGIPEWDALVNREITPMLEARATRLINSPLWKESNQRTRQRQVRALMKQVKADMREILAKETFDGATRNAQRKWLSRDEDLRIQAKQRFNLGGVKDHELTIPQIEMMEFWIKETTAATKAAVSP